MNDNLIAKWGMLCGFMVGVNFGLSAQSNFYSSICYGK